MASFCAACGASLSSEARFCSVCGNAVTHPAALSTARTNPVSLVRPRAGRKIAGVCQGLANHFGWDVTWTRVITILLAVTLLPFGLLLYAVLWLTMPEEPLAVLAPTTNLDIVS
jgi:phage shock protein C